MSPPQHNVPSATLFLLFILEWPKLMFKRHLYLNIVLVSPFWMKTDILMNPEAVGITREQHFWRMSPPQQNISKSQLFGALIVFIQDTNFIYWYTLRFHYIQVNLHRVVVDFSGLWDSHCVPSATKILISPINLLVLDYQLLRSKYQSW